MLLRQLTITLLLFTALISGLHAEPGPRPNIIFIFSDDHATQAIGAYGSRLQSLDPTPQLDRLAREGMRFDRFYVANSICAPSRATLLTGKHSHLNGQLGNGKGFDHDQQTFPKLLQQHGYQTAIAGKVHLNGQIQGFDWWRVLPGQGRYFQPEFDGPDGREIHRGHVSDITTDLALDWLDEQRDPGRPFLLMVHHKAPHRKWRPALRHLPLWKDVEIPEPGTLFDDYATRGTAAREQDLSIDQSMNFDLDLKVIPRAQREAVFSRFDTVGGGQMHALFKLRNEVPALAGLNWNHWGYYRMTAEQRKVWDAFYDPINDAFLAADLKGKDLIRWKYQRYLKDYLRCARGVDDSVGRILDALDTHGLSNDTVVIYSSDQGFFLGEHGWFDKRFMYEESFRAPLIVRWPGQTPPGTSNEDLTQNIDLAPTFLDLAGAPIPDDLQGRSLAPLFRNESPKEWRQALYYNYHEYPGGHSVRRHEGIAGPRYKLIRFYGHGVPGGEEWELFDLEKDPAELENRYDHPEHAALVRRMKQDLLALRQQYQVPEDLVPPFD